MDRGLVGRRGTVEPDTNGATNAFATANEPKRLHWIEGANHIDLYDCCVPQVLAEVVPFFTQNLAAQLAHTSA